MRIGQSSQINAIVHAIGRRILHMQVFTAPRRAHELVGRRDADLMVRPLVVGGSILGKVVGDCGIAAGIDKISRCACGRCS
jgi:hypothetical protein